MNREYPVSEAALDGVKVVTFEQGVAVPFMTAMLAGYGASVVRVESATRLEWHRQVGPFLGGIVSPDHAIPYLFVNSGKYSASLNLKKREAVEVARRLAAWSDVVVENFAGGVMDRLGLGYRDLKEVNPRVIMMGAAIYGQTGPMASARGHGNQLSALTGTPHLTGFSDQPPQFPGFTLTDFTAPRAALLAVMAALDHQRRTGEGQYLDASQLESAVHLMSPVLLDYQVNGRESKRIGNRSNRAAPHGVFRCYGEDRWCAIAVFTDDDWLRFRRAIGQPGWADSQDYATVDGRLNQVSRLENLVEAWTQRHSPEEVASLLQNAGVTAAVVENESDLTRDPQLKHRGFFHELGHSNGMGNYVYGGTPVQMSINRYRAKPAPMLGEHTGLVCREFLGMSPAEYARLESDEVFK